MQRMWLWLIIAWFLTPNFFMTAVAASWIGLTLLLAGLALWIEYHSEE